MTLRNSASPRETQEMLDWVRRQGLDPYVIPPDGITIEPDEDGTTITWLEFVLGVDGRPVLDEGVVRTEAFARRVPDVAPFRVVDGSKVPPLRGSRLVAGHDDGGVAGRRGHVVTGLTDVRERTTPDEGPGPRTSGREERMEEES